MMSKNDNATIAQIRDYTEETFIRHIKQKAELAKKHGLVAYENLSNGFTVQTIPGKIVHVISQAEIDKVMETKPSKVTPEEWILSKVVGFEESKKNAF